MTSAALGAPVDERTHTLHCMEIWGGNAAVDEFISVPGVDAHVISRPHEGGAGGGDIHYVSTCAAGIISRFVLADVSGHGESASAVAGSLRRLMRKHVNEADQSLFTRALNREFGGLSESGRFATAILASYFAPTDHLIVCNAGHPPPLWFRAAEGRWQELTAEAPGVQSAGRQSTKGVRDLPLGIIEPTEYLQFAAALGAGDIVVFYTDALIEAAPKGGKMLGAAGLLRLAESMDRSRPEEIGPRLMQGVADYRGTPADDDATVLVLHHNAAEAPSLSLAERVRVWGRMLGVMS